MHLYLKSILDLVHSLQYKKTLLLLFFKDFSFRFIWIQVQLFFQPFVILSARTEEFVYLLSSVSVLQGPVGNIVQNISWTAMFKTL